tara:strand:+ start:126 stop:551 length:426 start_codon:yes stop_codon:yes gene_type:complete
MIITTVELIALAIFWTIFYFFLSHYIAGLSRDAWVEYIRSEESDEMLLEALDPIVNEIEDRMHDKLEHFQKSFFGSLGAASKKIDEATGQATIKAVTKDNPLLGFVAEYMMKRGGLGSLMDPKSPDTAPSQPKVNPKLGLK